MLAKTLGLSLKAIQDHVLEVLVLRYLVLVLNGWIMPYSYYGNDDEYVSRGYCLLSTLH